MTGASASSLGRTRSAFALSSPQVSSHCSQRPAAQRTHSYDSGSSFLELDSPVTPYSPAYSMSTPMLAGHGYSESFSAQATSTPSAALDRPRTMSTSKSSAPLGLRPTDRPATAEGSSPHSRWNTVKEWSSSTIKSERVARPKGPRPLPPTPGPAFCGMPPAAPFTFEQKPRKVVDHKPSKDALAALPSPTSAASKPHPNQVGARRLSLNTIKKLSARPLASPTLALDSARSSTRPSAHGFLLDLPSPCPSSASSELHVPELTADEGTSSAAEWEDELDDEVSTPGDEMASEIASTYSGEGTAIVCKAFRAPTTAPMFLAPPTPTTPTPRKKRPTPPPLTLVTQGSFLLSDPSPVSPSVYTLRSSPGRKRRSQASRRRASRRASTVTAGTRDSMISNVSLFPTFAAATPRQSAAPVAEPSSPHLMHPLHQRLAGKQRTRVTGTMQQLTHTIEPGRSPKVSDSKARKRLGLDANDNVVEITEGDDLTPKLRPDFLDAPLTKPVPQKKKSTFSVRKFFARRR
ncbi:hypothetical protein AURDEDRAFT_153891 [Auricularia subglabra TFB-10046 SS5]|nr:hypothetical protein AURDEDRAFT_153891 [Auricularia subglabra TFB-10046 SS5]